VPEPLCALSLFYECSVYFPAEISPEISPETCPETLLETLPEILAKTLPEIFSEKYNEIYPILSCLKINGYQSQLRIPGLEQV